MVQRVVKLTRNTLTLDELISKKKSMLTDDLNLPINYDAINDEHDIETKAYPRNEKQVRLYIVWDNKLRDHPLNRVLDHMRETGAAMVYKVEAIEP